MPIGDYPPNYGGFPNNFGSIGTSGYVGPGVPAIYRPIHSSSYPTIDPETLNNINTQLVIIRENQQATLRAVRDLAGDVARLRDMVLDSSRTAEERNREQLMRSASQSTRATYPPEARLGRAEVLGAQQAAIGAVVLDSRAAARIAFDEARPEPVVTPLHNPDNRNIQPNL